MKIRALANIRRFNFEKCIHYQSVAEHSFFVAMIAYDVAKRMNLNPYCRAYAGLIHDIEEAITGDIPHLVKRNVTNMFELNRLAMIELDMNRRNVDYVEEDIVLFADAYELALYLQEERRLGNTCLIDIEAETIHRLKEQAKDYSIFWEYIDELLPLPEGIKSKELPEEMKH